MFELAGALLGRGQYRSAPAYVEAVKRLHISAGFPWTDLQVHIGRDAVRTVSRGQGPAKQVEQLPLELIVERASEITSKEFDPTWPIEPIAMFMLVCAWLTREIESSAAMPKHETLHEPHARGCRVPLVPHFCWHASLHQETRHQRIISATEERSSPGSTDSWQVWPWTCTNACERDDDHAEKKQLRPLSSMVSRGPFGSPSAPCSPAHSKFLPRRVNTKKQHLKF